MVTSWIRKVLVTAVASSAMFVGAAAATSHAAFAHDHYHAFRGYQGPAHVHHRGGGPQYTHGYQGPRPLGYHYHRADSHHPRIVIAP